MEEWLKFIISVVILGFGFPIGKFLAKITDDELKAGQIWFKLLIIISLIGAVISLIIKEDYLLFSLLFIAIVTSQSLKLKVKKKRKR